MSFQIWNNDNTKKTNINLRINSDWKSLAEKVDNKYLSSIFKKIDNGDGKVSQEELDLFNKIMQIADSQKSETSGNSIIENEEADKIMKKIFSGAITDDLKNNLMGEVTNKTKFKNYIYFDFPEKDARTDFDLSKRMNTEKINVVYDELISEIQKNPNKTYKITSYERTRDKNGNIIEKPRYLEIQESQVGKKINWSEGLDRNIRTIQVTNDQRESEMLEKVIPELKAIGTEMGFNVKTINGGDTWLEDYSIMLNDGYRYSPNDNFKIKSDKNITNSDRYKSGIMQQQGQVNRNKVANKYANNYQENDIVKGKSYLEGGNVLNTCKNDGTPAAVIGEDSIYYTLQSMGLESNDENIDIAKKQIAQDLHLKPENVTFIPQLDFHIDMTYRPLHNGEIAVPDYEEGISILKSTNIKGMTEDEKNKLIEKLEYLKEKTNPIIEKTNEKLVADGYKTVKIPCFSDINVLDLNNLKKGETIKGINPINYMNGVGGTANNKNKDTFYITNTSGYPELDNAMKNHFKNIGIDKTFFVSTTSFLKRNGGIDCLTQEI